MNKCKQFERIHVKSDWKIITLTSDVIFGYPNITDFSGTRVSQLSGPDPNPRKLPDSTRPEPEMSGTRTPLIDVKVSFYNDYRQWKELKVQFVLILHKIVIIKFNNKLLRIYEDVHEFNIANIWQNIYYDIQTVTNLEHIEIWISFFFYNGSRHCSYVRIKY